MRLVQINATCGSGSTGKICTAVSELLDEKNVENYIFYVSGESSDPHGIKYVSPYELKLQALASRIFGNYGFNSRIATKRLIKGLEKISPDIVHLHNIHGHNVNLSLLFEYFKKNPKIKLFWTFHDCWAFTAYCPHFTMAKCDKWKTGCENCPQKGEYSWFFDRSKALYQKKKELFSGLDLTVITPSQWLCDIVKQSFMGEYPVKVINNGIDLSIFKPTESKILENLGLKDKHIVLGVAFDWGEKKGLDAVIELSELLSDDYRIVLVGTNSAVDKLLTDKIISVHRTENQRELAEIYSLADVFINTTREENFPTVNMEAVACGTPVVTFDTGGSKEMLDNSCGRVVGCDDIEAMKKEIENICEKGILKKEDCVKKAQSYAKEISYEKYLKEYNI